MQNQAVTHFETDDKVKLHSIAKKTEAICTEVDNQANSCLSILP